MKPCIVTTSWDDGSIFDLKLVEALEKYGIKGTLYIPKSYLGNPLEEKDLRTINEKFEIGAHTLNHADLTKISLLEARGEIEGSKAYLEELLGHKISLFCYPKGHYNEGIKRAVRDAGFVAARTINYGDFSLPRDPYQWQITLHAANGSPLMTFRTWLKSGISPRSLVDWEIRSKLLFDLVLQKGGIYHLWGHSWEIEKNNEWAKLERVLRYMSNKRDIHFMTNGEIFGLPKSWLRESGRA